MRKGGTLGESKKKSGLSLIIRGPEDIDGENSRQKGAKQKSRFFWLLPLLFLYDPLHISLTRINKKRKKASSRGVIQKAKTPSLPRGGKKKGSGLEHEKKGEIYKKGYPYGKDFYRCKTLSRDARRNQT